MNWQEVPRRAVYLLIGAAFCLAVAIIVWTFSPALAGPGVPMPAVVVGLGSVPVLTIGLLPGIRDLQVEAARSLLRVDTGLVRPQQLRWEHRWRTAVYTAAHQILGFATGLWVVLAVWVLGALAVVIVRGGQAEFIVRLARPSTPLGWALTAAGAVGVVAGTVGLVLGAGAVMARAASRLLGPTSTDRLAEVTARLHQETEYRRLSRDLHDGVGHALSGISLHATAGARLLRRDPDVAAESFTTIEALAGRALGELDQVLALLRDDEPLRQPEPGLDQLETLVDEHRKLGLDVTFEVAELPVGPLLSTTAYRVCSEALHNAAKHGGPGPVTLRVGPEGDHLVITATNPAGTDAPSRRRGRGLVGLDERVALLGGRFEAGAENAQWRLSAHLPWAVGHRG
ncbi:sensor histidine kinase [Pseudonocardia xinjiangensis]|uniref:sensor histidine kinase n=1 Tax=Pseudonocardia xinjiangensis TaxID=75289 RepID=UPI003D94CE36